MLQKQTIEQFTQNLASNAPTPGGGSALALVGATACALVEMSVSVTLAKMTPNDENFDYLSHEQTWFCRARQCLQRLADEDVDAFNNIMAGFKMPKDTPDNAKARKAFLQKCYHKGALIPLDVMQMCRDALVRADGRVLPFVNKFVSSDCVIGMDLLKTVARNSICNVHANTTLIADKELSTKLESQADAIIKDIER